MQRQIKFRGKRLDNGEWVYGFLFELSYDSSSALCIGTEPLSANDYSEIYDSCYAQADPTTVGQYTGLKDKNGVEIYEGDILRFVDDCGTWIASAVFERGLFGIDVCSPKQIENPADWGEKHDKVKSKWWSAEWGYEEYGTAFTYREPLAKRTLYTEGSQGDSEAWEKSEYKAWHEKHGWGEYRLDAEVIGNIHDNPDLLEQTP